MIIYKGYSAKAELDEESGDYVGKIEGIKDTVLIASGTRAGFPRAFFTAVNDYLQTCEEVGKEPERPANYEEMMSYCSLRDEELDTTAQDAD